MLKMVGFHSWVVGAVFDGVSLKNKEYFLLNLANRKNLLNRILSVPGRELFSTANWSGVPFSKKSPFLGLIYTDVLYSI